MNYPIKAESLKANDAKLGGKYRMSNVREFISLAYLLYVASDRKASVDYSNGKDSPNQLKLNSSLSGEISNILSVSNLESLVDNNPLLTGQFEYILVAMERVFCLGSVSFNNKSYSNSKERTGGIRYPKTLRFSTNMMVLDLILSSIDKSTRMSFLKEWLQNRPFSDNEIEKKITSFLTICSQYSLFRVRTENDDEIVYRPLGIYEQIVKSGNVSIVDSREQAGTASIYNNVLKENLNPWLNSRKTDNISFNTENDITSYLAMLKTSLSIARVNESDFIGNQTSKINFDRTISEENPFIHYPYLPAIRTKPFILLAGISGTGKSRIVRKLAQATDDIDQFENDDDRWNLQRPANFELIQVKPNWHNSMDVVGFFSNIPEPHYEFTPFVDFIVKAWCYPQTPFFLCLDEMNLAPVEEYFAEFLSAIESRGIGGGGEYETDPIIKPFDSFGSGMAGDMMKHFKDMGYDIPTDVENRFRKNGLTLPKNLIVMGTVNMDETTFSFSRKVLDRAMSIEMNEVNYDDFIEGATEYNIPNLVGSNELLVDRPISAQKVKGNIDSAQVIEFLKGINEMLDSTPFKLGYRAANEAMLYVSADKDFGRDNLLAALDEFALMKILSRIEGDDSKLVTKDGDNLLDKLHEYLSDESVFGTLENSKSLEKLDSMMKTLKRDRFVSFWG